MSRVTIECPQCMREHEFIWHTDKVARGAFHCECGEKFSFLVCRLVGESEVSPMASSDRVPHG